MRDDVCMYSLGVVAHSVTSSGLNDGGPAGGSRESWRF